MVCVCTSLPWGDQVLCERGARSPPTLARLQIVSVLQTVGKKEGIIVPNDMAMKIARHSSRNMRRAILMLEACKVQK